MKNALRRVSAFAGGSAILAVGCYFVSLELERERIARESPDWPTASGRVLESDVVRSVRQRGETHEEEVFHPAVRYRYEVEGQRYTGSRLAAWPASSSDRSEARRRAGRYREDAWVAVHYDPADPSRAVLEPGGTDPGRNGPLYAAAGFGLMGGLAAVVVGLFGVTGKSKRKRRRGRPGFDVDVDVDP